MTRRFPLALCITLIVGLCPACSTVKSLSSDDPATPKIYGGVRMHLKEQSEADAGSKQLGKNILAAIFDLPFSAICDTLLLPVTVFLEPDSPEKVQLENEREKKRRDEREEDRSPLTERRNRDV